MAHEDHGARELVERLREALAAVDVEMVGRLVEDQQVRGVVDGEAEGEPRLLAARHLADLGVGLVARKADLGRFAAHLRFVRGRHQPADVIAGRAVEVEILHVMLGEEADLHLLGLVHPALARLQAVGQQLREGRLAVAVRSKQRDPVVRIDAKRQAVQDGAVAIAGRHPVERDQRRRQLLLGLRDAERHDAAFDHGVDRLHLGEPLDARLGLGRLRSLGLEAGDEGLEPLALFVLGLGGLEVERELLAAHAVERVVIALPDVQLAVLEVEDVIDRGVQQVAVMADDEGRALVFGEVVLKPEGAFEVEVVGGLVEEEEVGLREQNRRERDAHAPAAGKVRAGTLLRVFVKAEARKNPRGARGRLIGVDVDEPRDDLGDAVRIGRGLLLLHQPRALEVGCENDVDERLRAGRRLLRDAAKAQALRHLDLAIVRVEVAREDFEQSRLAGAVAADHADARPLRQEGARVVEQHAPGDAAGDFVDLDHGGAFVTPTALRCKRTRRRERRRSGKPPTKP